MIKLHHFPLSRSVRILWLLEELDLPCERMVARAFGVLTPSQPNTDQYFTRLIERPAFRTALSA